MNKKSLNLQNGLVGNIARVLSANFIVAVVSLLGNFIFPRILTISDYAMYHTFTLYLGYISITHLGFPSGMAINYVGKNYEEIDPSKYKSEIRVLMCILGFFTLVFGIYAFFSKNEMAAYITAAIIPMGIISSYKSLNIPAFVSLLSGDRKPQIRF